MSSNGNSPNGRGRYECRMVGPEEANRLLGLNAVNRPIKKTKVAQFAADMISGHWRGWDSPITIREDERLLDGQNRMGGILLSGATIEMWFHVVSEDIEPKDLRVDLGSNRSIQDFTDLTSREVATARVLARIAAPNLSRSADDVIEICAKIAQEYNRLTDVTRAGLSCAVKAAACFSVYKHPSDADAIIAQYNAMMNAHHDYPLWPAVSSALRQCLTDLGGGGAIQVLKFMRMTRAFSAASRNSSRISFRDIESARAEIAPKVAVYIAVPS